jgi:hypothetical protein
MGKEIEGTDVAVGASLIRRWPSSSDRSFFVWPGCALQGHASLLLDAGARRGASPHQRVEHGERAVARATGEARPFGAQEVSLMADATEPATARLQGAPWVRNDAELRLRPRARNQRRRRPLHPNAEGTAIEVSRNTPELDGRNDSQPTRSHDAALCPKNRVGTPGTTSARLARPLEERAGCQRRFATRYVRGQSTFASRCLAFSIP